MNAEILSVGTELLLGGTVNTDARDISLALAELGINVYWHTVVGDNPARLTECLYRARNRADLIITTGGLGPTCDDLTKQTIARAFNRELYLDDAAMESIRSYFAERGRSFTDNNVQQAYLPEGCIVLPNDCGTAPGCIIEDGNVRVVMLPGPPRECVTMLRNHVLPYLRALSDDVIRSHTVRFFGIGESTMETKLRSLMDGANPTVAPYSREGECWVRITAKGKSADECETLMQPVIDEVCRRMGDRVYGTDCASLEERVLQLLDEKNVSLATAESCTGGLLAQRITDIPGASAHFRGGVVVYTEDAKERLLGVDKEFIAENGVVSLPVAGKMAKRVRKELGSDIGIGITGWAGPDGEDVGLVFVALSVRGGCFVRRLQCGHAPRPRIRLIAASNALDMIRRYLTGLDV
jgi:nicotinamide-nucleotide amidase